MTVTHPRVPRYAYATLALIAVLVFAWIARPVVALSSDSIFALAWGGELAEGQLPDFSGGHGLPGEHGPAKHPLTIGLAFLVGPLTPQGSVDAFSMFGVLAFLAVLYASFWLGRTLAGVAAGALAATLVAAHPLVKAAATRGLTDGLFAALALLAAALAIESGPRRWREVLSLLALAGLLRPEGWALALAYGTWVALRSDRWRRRIVVGALVLAAPALWLAVDLALTGDPLHSIQHRNRPVERALLQDRDPEALPSGGGRNKVQEIIRRSGDQPDCNLPGCEIAGVAIVIRWPLILAGALIAAWALWSGRRSLLSGLKGERLEGESAALWPYVLLSLAVLGVMITLVFMYAWGFPVDARYLLAPGIALMVLAAASPWVIPRSPVSVALGVILVPVVVAETTISGLATFPGSINTEAERRARFQDLVALVEAPAVHDALMNCPKLEASGRLLGEARAGAAVVLGLDPADIGVTAGSHIPPGGSVIAYDPSTQLARARVEGDWVFTSRCLP
jgi:hypothetical protein